MATYSRSLRRGLPRVAGGDPWPPSGDAPVEIAAAVADVTVGDGPVAEARVAAVPVADVPVAEASVADVPVAEAPVAAASVSAPVEAPAEVPVVAPVASAAPATASASLRRGLPRVEGGEPWPAAGSAPAPTTAPAASTPAAAPAAPAPAASVSEPTPATPAAAPAAVASAPAPVAAAPVAATSVVSGDAVTLRRGLPRVEGGDGWPPAGSVAHPTVSVPAETVVTVDASTDQVVEVASIDPASGQSEVVIPAARVDVSQPLPFKQTVFPGAYADVPVEVVERRRYGKFTAWQWVGVLALSGAALLGAAAMAVITVRFLMSLDVLKDFTQTYPGEYHLPEGTQEGFPAWVQWQHYFNAFFMLLIIRTGLSVRNDRRPSAFWTPRWSKDGKGKISLTLWLHQALDLLWVINGIVFIVLLFVTGHWARIVPTSWEVFPNALSAALQYVSLDWPVEDGWVNYNSLQQLMYFTVVFIAAPLAIITGLRMSDLWPKKAAALNKAYPVEVARAIHFPTMLFFVFFIIVHVFLVLATGALRNLNHMFGGNRGESWIGFWILFAGLCVMAAAWFAMRPLVVAPIAKLFGKVSAR